MKIVLIGGTRKSGTTIFHSLFDGHKDLIVPPHDLNVLYAFYPRWSLKSKAIQKKRLYKVTILDWLKKYKSIQDKKEYKITSKIMVSFFNQNFEKYDFSKIEQLFDFSCKLASSPFEKKRKKYLIIKETSSEFHILNLKKKIYFLNLIRDPRDIVSAMLPGLEKGEKYEKINETYLDIIFSTFFRYSFSDQILKITKKNKNNFFYKNVFFEKLLNNPKKIMKSICFFLNLNFDKILLSPTRMGRLYSGNSLDNINFKHLSKKNIGRWKMRLNKQTISYVEALLGVSMLKKQYKISKKRNRSLATLYSQINDKYFFKDRYK